MRRQEDLPRGVVLLPPHVRVLREAVPPGREVLLALFLARYHVVEDLWSRWELGPEFFAKQRVTGDLKMSRSKPKQHAC